MTYLEDFYWKLSPDCANIYEKWITWTPAHLVRTLSDLVRTPKLVQNCSGTILDSL